MTTEEAGEKNFSRESLIEEYIPYVKRMVHRIAIHLPSNVIEMDDLINAGVIGLIQAVDNYDPLRVNKFITYAAFRIKGAILSELRSHDFLSRTIRSRIRELEKTCLELEQKYCREVEDNEVAEEMGIDLEQFYHLKKMASLSLISFEDIGFFFAKKEKDNMMSCLTAGYTENAFTYVRLKEISDAIAAAVKNLPEKEKLVISLYYQDGLTMKEIGKVLDITESRVSQLHSRAILSLRKKLRDSDLLDD